MDRRGDPRGLANAASLDHAAAGGDVGCGGEATARLLGLDREAIDEARRHGSGVVSALYDAWRALPDGPLRETAAAGLRAATEDDAPFCAMSRALVGRT